MRVTWKAGDFSGEAEFKGGGNSTPQELEDEMRVIVRAFMDALMRAANAKVMGERLAGERQN